MIPVCRDDFVLTKLTAQISEHGNTVIQDRTVKPPDSQTYLEEKTKANIKHLWQRTGRLPGSTFTVFCKRNGNASVRGALTFGLYQIKVVQIIWLNC